MPGVYDLWAPRRVSAASYIAYKAPSQHPDRIMQEHDLVYFLEGEWEVYQDNIPYLLRRGDVLLLHGGRHHYSKRPCLAGTNTIYIHIFPAPGDSYLPPEEQTGTNASPFPQEPLPEWLPERISCQENETVRILFDALAKAFALEAYKKEESFPPFVNFSCVNSMPAHITKFPGTCSAEPSGIWFPAAGKSALQRS